MAAPAFPEQGAAAPRNLACLAARRFCFQCTNHHRVRSRGACLHDVARAFRPVRDRPRSRESQRAAGHRSGTPQSDAQRAAESRRRSQRRLPRHARTSLQPHLSLLLARGGGFRVARSSRVSAKASRLRELPSRVAADIADDISTDAAGKFVLAGRQDQTRGTRALPGIHGAPFTQFNRPTAQSPNFPLSPPHPPRTPLQSRRQ